MWIHGPAVIAPTSAKTSRRNGAVAGRAASSRENPTSIPVYASGATPDGFSSGTAWSAAFVCPGTSISGTTVMPRRAAAAWIRA